MWDTVIRGVIAGLIVAAVTGFSKQSPRVGAFMLNLPIVSILALVMSWNKDRDLTSIASLARETLILVPLGLPFFIPLALSERLGFGFWTSFMLGLGASAVPVGLWLALGPK